MAGGQPLPHDQERTLTIAQAVERTGLSHDTLRYYEKAGLIERVGRTKVFAERGLLPVGRQPPTSAEPL